MICINIVHVAGVFFTPVLLERCTIIGTAPAFKHIMFLCLKNNWGFDGAQSLQSSMFVFRISCALLHRLNVPP